MTQRTRDLIVSVYSILDCIVNLFSFGLLEKYHLLKQAICFRRDHMIGSFYKLIICRKIF